MAQALISAKYLYDIAEAIRVKLGSQDTFTPAQMATAISNISGSLSGSITPSSDTGVGLITDTYLNNIADAIRAKLNVETQYTPAQMADAILSITGGGPTIVSWSTGTDEEIVAMLEAAHDGVIDLQQDGGWAVGDTRTISIAAFTGYGSKSHSAQSIDIVISSFDEYMSCGNVLQFDFKNVVSGVQHIGASGTYAYGSSPMKTTTLPALVNALPTWLKDNLIEFSVLACEYGGNVTTVTGNKLALRSEVEVYGNYDKSYIGEGSQIPYYASVGGRKSQYGSTGKSNWWLRSKYNANQYYYLCDSGNSSSGQIPNKSDYYYISPFGCL